MKRHAAVALAAGIFAIGALNASADTSAATEFLQTSNGSLSSCVRILGEADLDARLYGSAAPSRIGEMADCVSAGRSKLRAAYDLYLASSPSTDAKAAARGLYAARLALADAISAASSRPQVEDSQEQAEVRKATALFVIDAGI